MSEACFACAGVFAAEPGGANHAYMASSPACWAAYGLVLEKEYADPALFGRCHRLTVDAFAVQYPGDPAERHARQSFWVHGAALWMVLELGRPQGEAAAALERLTVGDCPVPPAPTGFAALAGRAA
jgi:hypothetical protein